jgi:NAD(P)-dependent dehydrogenase (short-subunit alcohol dehydrogenase family)
MTGACQRVAIITGGSQGVGASLVAAYRRRDWAVVANSRTSKPSEDGAVLTISGDISEPATTNRIIGEALDRFGRIDTLINNAGIFIAKPFTYYTADEYASVVAVNLTGFFTLTQRAIAEMLKRSGGHILVNLRAALSGQRPTSGP